MTSCVRYVGDGGKLGAAALWGTDHAAYVSWRFNILHEVTVKGGRFLFLSLHMREKYFPQLYDSIVLVTEEICKIDNLMFLGLKPEFLKLSQVLRFDCLFVIITNLDDALVLVNNLKRHSSGSSNRFLR